jgi:hypothetical protein
MIIVGKKNGETVTIDVPGDGFDAFLAFLKSGANHPFQPVGPPSLAVVPIASTGAPSSSEMRKKQRNKSGGCGRGRLDPPPSPTPIKTKGNHGPAPPSPSPTAATAKTTGTVDADPKRNEWHNVPGDSHVKDNKKVISKRLRGGGLLRKLARRLRLFSHPSGKEATIIAARDEVEVRRRNDLKEASSISSNESRESALSTIFPYHRYTAENEDGMWSSPGTTSSSCSVMEQCSVQYSATYDRSELGGDASTWAFSIVGGGEIESIEGNTVFDGYIDVNDLLRNARNFEKQPAWIAEDERRKMERMCGAFEV